MELWILDMSYVGGTINVNVLDNVRYGHRQRLVPVVGAGWIWYTKSYI